MSEDIPGVGIQGEGHQFLTAQSAEEHRFLLGFSREVVDLLHDKGYLAREVTRANQRWLEEVGMPDLLLRYKKAWEEVQNEAQKNVEV